MGAIPQPFLHQKASLQKLTESLIIFDTSDPGTGKTLPEVLDFAARRRKRGKCMLVLATKSLLTSAWESDFRKFAPDMKVSVAFAENRAKAFAADADVYATNHDAAVWLAKQPASFFAKFDTLVVDESTALKHHTSMRSKSVAKIVPHFKYRRLLTGTPNSNGVCDLWHQIYLLDGGQRLGKSFYAFRKAACDPIQVGPASNMVNWVDRESIELTVAALIRDITIRHKFEDCVDIPANHQYARTFKLNRTHMKAYQTMQDDRLVQLRKTTVTAVNAAAVAGKLLQIACLKKGTPVLTISGWKPIECVTHLDKVWDGISWVSCGGGVYSKTALVIECDGVFMTLDHKVLTVSGWATAREVTYGNADRRFERASVWIPNRYRTGWTQYAQKYPMVDAVPVRETGDSHRFEPEKCESTLPEIMRVPSKSDQPDSDWNARANPHKHVLQVGQHQRSMQQPLGQRLRQLWGTWNNCLSRMGRFIRNISCRYGTFLQGWFNLGSDRQYQRVLQGELPMGYSERTEQQPARYSIHRHTLGKAATNGGVADLPNQGDHPPCSDKAWGKGFGYPANTSACPVEVYDVANAGPLHRYTVMGSSGQTLIVHNSGAVYDDNNSYSLVDSARYEMILDLVEEREHSIVFFNWVHQRDELIKEVTRRGISFAVYDGTTSTRDRTAIVKDYQAGKYRVLFAHPQSAGHGLTLTKGTATIWASPTYNLEHFLQGLKRVHRIGQTQRTETIVIVAEGTIDEVVWQALQDKNVKLVELLEGLK